MSAYVLNVMPDGTTLKRYIQVRSEGDLAALVRPASKVVFWGEEVRSLGYHYSIHHRFELPCRMNTENNSILSNEEYRSFHVNRSHVFHLTMDELDILYSIVLQSEVFWDRFSFGLNPYCLVGLLSRVNKSFRSATLLPQNIKYLVGNFLIGKKEAAMRFGFTRTDFNHMKSHGNLLLYDVYMYRHYCRAEKKKSLLARSIKNILAYNEKYPNRVEDGKKAIAMFIFLKEEGMCEYLGSSFDSPVSLDDGIKADVRFRYFVKKYYWTEYYAHVLQFTNDYKGSYDERIEYAWQKMKESLGSIDFSKPYGEIPKPLR